MEGDTIPYNRSRGSELHRSPFVYDDQDPAALPTTIAPSLSLRNGAPAVEFYKSALGQRKCFGVEKAAGQVVRGFRSRARGFDLGGESHKH